MGFLTYLVASKWDSVRGTHGVLHIWWQRWWDLVRLGGSSSAEWQREEKYAAIAAALTKVETGTQY